MVRSKKHIPSAHSSPQNPRQKAEERLRQQNAALLDLVKIATGEDHPWIQALNRIMETSAHTLAVERTSVWMYTEDRAAIRCIDLFERKENRHSAGMQLGIERYPHYFDALEEERVIAAHDAHLDPRTEEFGATYLKPLGITSMLDAPIRWRGRIVGLICHEHTGRPRYWSAEEQQFAASVADIIAVAMETVERKRAQNALLESEARFRTLVSQVKDYAIFSLDKKGIVNTWNQGVKYVLGYDEKEFIGIDATKLFTPEAIAESIPQWELKEAAEKGSANNDRWMMKKNGARFFSNGITTALKDASGELIGFTKVMRDRTDQKLAEEEIHHYADEILRSNKDLEQFAYIASHDLQEPLRIVSNYAEILKMKYKDKFDDKGKKFADNIIDNIYRMQELINDLLSYSSLGKEKTFREIDMQKVCRQVTKNLGLLIKETGAEISCQELPKIIGDEIQMMQLLQNLISNAIKFRSPDRAPKVQISAKAEKREWILSVKDNGIGIEPEYHDRIFEIFKRLHNRHEYPGTGIGLAICKKIIDSHQGRIWLESKQGEGTTFFIAIPKEMPRRSFQKPSQNSLSK